MVKHLLILGCRVSGTNDRTTKVASVILLSPWDVVHDALTMKAHSWNKYEAYSGREMGFAFPYAISRTCFISCRSSELNVDIRLSSFGAYGIHAADLFRVGSTALHVSIGCHRWLGK